MISLNFFFWGYTFVFTYIYLEIFYTLIYYSLFKSLKMFNLNFIKKLNYFIFKNQIFTISINLNLIYLLTLKCNFVNNNILSIILMYLIVSKFLNSYLNYNIMFINFNIIFFLFFFLFINSIIIFFLFVELYSIIFYFFFLNNNKMTNISLLQFKNGLLLYLFNNFFITILFLLGINYTVEFYGTTNFTELMYLNNTTVYWQIYFLIIAFLFKLALPGFHYLKLEIYKYLNMDITILYSVITIFINYTFTIFFFNHNIIFYTLNSFKLINILVLLSFFFFIQKLKLTNFQEFISYSGFATNNLIILNFII